MDQALRTIRTLTSADAEIWRTIRLEALRDAPEAFGQTFENGSVHPLDDVAKAIAGPDPILAAAFAGDRPVGTAGFRRLDGPKHGHRGSLWGMYVAPDFRRRGIGRDPIETVIAHARALVVQLHRHVVARNTAAYSLYRRMGFVTYGIEPRAQRFNGRDEDEAMMVRMLDGADKGGGHG